MKEYLVTILPGEQVVSVPEGTGLLSVLRDLGLAPDSPCGGRGTCGKCRVLVNGEPELACQKTVEENMTVLLSEKISGEQILSRGIYTETALAPVRQGKHHLAYDIGTTTVVCYLLDGQTGKELACHSKSNPQRQFGADVVSRIRHAQQGGQEQLTEAIRSCMTELAASVCAKAGAEPAGIGVVSVVGNPCMQQLFLGISTENLAALPFTPVLTKARVEEAKEYLPLCPNAALLTVPDISGYVGGDTMACLLANRQYAREERVLMVDIGTNGEMVLGNAHAMTACATAAGPALEGAMIHFGMRGAEGAIDRVWLENGEIQCHVIGEGPARGICGSGLIDAAAAMLQTGAINSRGRIQSAGDLPELAHRLAELEGMRIFRLRDGVYLTQQDIRELQLAKGAIAAGIQLMAESMNLALEDIQEVQLAGAFGTVIRPESAARIGLIPPVLVDRIRGIGNAAGSGAKLLALNREELARTDTLVQEIRGLNLASLEDFQDVFVENMLFPEE